VKTRAWRRPAARASAPAALLCVAAALAAPALGGRVVLTRVSDGGYAASFAYTVGSERHSYTIQGKTTSFTTVVYSNFRVTLLRSGRPVFSGSIRCLDCVPGGLAAARPSSSLRFATLAGAREPSALVDFFTGGAHCCYVSYLLLPEARGARLLKHDWGDPGYRLATLGPGGELFVTADDRFAYTFTDYAASVLPVEVLRLDGARLLDVTRSYPAALEADAARQWLLYLKVRATPSPDVRGVLAAWAADEALLGRWQAATATLTAALARGELAQGPTVWPLGRAYIAALGSFLRKDGYL
jgi:hypothetical protein